MFDKQIVSKCDKCIIGKNEKAGKINLLHRNIGEIRRGSVDNEILIILSRYETDKFINLFEKKLKRFKLNSYCIISGLDCSIKDIKGYTQFELYKYCNTVDNLDKYKNLKVIITCGSGLFAITKSADIGGWWEFKEYLFNQTYFYTGFNYSKKGIRVYPIPFLDEFLIKYDSFERFFVDKQLKFIREYLNDN